MIEFMFHCFHVLLENLVLIDFGQWTFDVVRDREDMTHGIGEKNSCASVLLLMFSLPRFYYTCFKWWKDLPTFREFLTYAISNGLSDSDSSLLDSTLVFFLLLLFLPDFLSSFLPAVAGVAAAASRVS